MPRVPGENAVTPASHATPDERVDRRPLAIVVEDEFLVALHVKDLLSELGLNVVGHAARLSEALDLVQRCTDLDVAVLDVNLAGEMSWPVARMLRARGVPVIFVTGYLPAHTALPDDLADATMLSKPVDLRLLGNTLALRVPQMRRPLQ